MKTLEEVKQIKKDFFNDFFDLIKDQNNNLTTGIGRHNNEHTINVYLENENGKDILPKQYKGVEVVVTIIGKVYAL